MEGRIVRLVVALSMYETMRAVKWLVALCAGISGGCRERFLLPTAKAKTPCRNRNVFKYGKEKCLFLEVVIIERSAQAFDDRKVLR